MRTVHSKDKLLQLFTYITYSNFSCLHLTYAQHYLHQHPHILTHTHSHTHTQTESETTHPLQHTHYTHKQVNT